MRLLKIMKNIRYRKKSAAAACFLLGFGLFSFTRMSLLVPTIPVMILIAPVFILHFIRTQPAGRGNLLTFLGFTLAMNIGLFGLFDLGTGLGSLAFNLIRSTLLALLYYLPYAFDRWLYPRLRGLRGFATVVFPVATTALFFLLTREGPFEGAIQTGKFVFGPLALQQGLSLLGLSGIVFMTSWFASLMNSVWEEKFAWRNVGGVLISFSAIVLTLYVFGLEKIASNRDGVETVRVAAVVPVPENGRAEELMPLFQDRTTQRYPERLEVFAEKVRLAATAGARIVSSHELAFLIDESDREDFTDRCRAIAAENDIYLAVGYGYYAREGKGENLLILIDPEGTLLLEYAKRYLVGIGNLGEGLVFRKGDGIIQYADTPWGKIGLAICRDMEMAKYIIQAGKKQVDILIAPAYEWPQNLTTLSGLQRGIENGCSLLRANYSGISFASDPDGRVPARMPFDNAGSGLMLASLPVEGVRPLYPRVGDLFAWLCTAALAGLILASFFPHKSRRGDDLFPTSLSP